MKHSVLNNLSRMLSRKTATGTLCAAIIAGALLLPSTSRGEEADYIDWGVCGSDFGAALKQWEKGQKWSDDDNFFISRVKPRQRFINRNTQIDPSIDETNDKNLIFWVPINDSDRNALPSGDFDSEVFPMWSYITHYGNWSAPLLRVPGVFLDVAHRNGVPVSAVASIPYGPISESWENGLKDVTEAGAEKLVDYLIYYGVDGIGYNSEFQAKPSLVKKLMQLHEETLAGMALKGNNAAEFIWYDGTNINGAITFDLGLGNHNRDIFGSYPAKRSSLFLNYNWNDASLLERSVREAENMGRSPLDLYCGINMQGREPHNVNPEIWTLLSRYPMSIGLWGAHARNMFFESRAEQGSSPEVRQRTYLERVRRWFSGGQGNPLTAPEINNSLIYSAVGDNFFGMAKMMSARSALKWNLDEEPFITNFNLGNGRFFNLEGRRCHDSEWYNIGVQDYLPTWMWWFAGSFLGRNPEEVPADGMKAEFTWDDAWNGGSSLRIYGSVDEEYLHLFKTEFPLKIGDRLRVRHKRLAGEGKISLLLSLKDSEEITVGDGLFLEDGAEGKWTESIFTVGNELEIPEGGEVAMIALRFHDAEELDMRLGEISIIRDNARVCAAPPKPVLTKSHLLHADKDGADGKLIFDLPSEDVDKRYNEDFGVSMFRLYSQQQGESPVMMGTTTGWGALVFGAPFRESAESRIRFGVSSLSLDHETESDIAWGDYEETTPLYAIDEGISVDTPVLVPDFPFTVSFDDPAHPVADWSIEDIGGNRIAYKAASRSLSMPEGLKAPGLYNLRVKGEDGERLLRGFLQVGERDYGAVPRILDYQTSDSGEAIRIDYNADFGEGMTSRALEIGETGAGFIYSEAGLKKGKSFSVSFWFRPDESVDEASHLFSIRDKGDAWSINNWGWCWHTLGSALSGGDFSVRTDSGASASYTVSDMQLYAGAWHHLTYVFDFSSGVLEPSIYCDGRKATLTPAESFPPVSDPVTGKWKNWSDGIAVAVGGYLHRCGSVNGSLDDMMVWDRAVTKSDVEVIMGSDSPTGLPDGLLGYFSFEDNPGDDNRFAAYENISFRAGSIGYKDTETEGQGTLEWRAPKFRPGAPMSSGSAFSVLSKVRWISDEAEILETGRNLDGGYALLSVPEKDKETPGNVRLEIANELGSDWRDIPLVAGLSDVREIGRETLLLQPTPSLFESRLSVNAPSSGDYTISLHDLEGRCLLSNRFVVEAGEKMTIYPEVNSGQYIVIMREGERHVGSCKVIRK